MDRARLEGLRAACGDERLLVSQGQLRRVLDALLAPDVPPVGATIFSTAGALRMVYPRDPLENWSA